MCCPASWTLVVYMSYLVFWLCFVAYGAAVYLVLFMYEPWGILDLISWVYRLAWIAHIFKGVSLPYVIGFVLCLLLTSVLREFITDMPLDWRASLLSLSLSLSLFLFYLLDRRWVLLHFVASAAFCLHFPILYDPLSLLSFY